MVTSHCILSLSFGNMTKRTFSIKTALYGCGVPTLIDCKVLQFSRVILVAHSEPMKTWNFFLRDSTGTFLRAISLFSLPRMRTLYHSSEISSHASNSRTFCAAREFCWKVPSHILMSSQTFELNISPLVCAALRQHSLRSLTFPLCMPQHSFECVSELFFHFVSLLLSLLWREKTWKLIFPSKTLGEENRYTFYVENATVRRLEIFSFFGQWSLRIMTLFAVFFLFSVRIMKFSPFVFPPSRVSHHARSHQGHVWSLPEKRREIKKKTHRQLSVVGVVWRVKRHFFRTLPSDGVRFRLAR